jgi:competence ComEA-like helix-hairpin-helix protein
VKRLTDAVTRWTGATRAESLLAVVICSTLFLGWTVRELSILTTPDPRTEPSAAALQHLVDSLEGATASTRIGTDADGEPYAPLAAADTAVRQPQRFPAATRSKAQPVSININTASLAQLMRLPGVGEATARRMMEHRAVSPFTIPEDIMQVKGIGPKKFAKMRSFVRVR